jgi:membrane protein implicated in regulation of membrane protease activity
MRALMLYLYLFTTILGGALLGGSLFAGDHHGGGDGGHDAGHDADHPTTGLNLFSLRLWTYVLAFGGATGLALTLLTPVGAVITGVCAGAVGLTAGVTAQTVIRRALKAGQGGTVRTDELVGRSAEVLVPIGKGATGTVRLLAKNSTIDLLATCDEGELSAKEEVLIVGMKDGQAIVTRNPATTKK